MPRRTASPSAPLTAREIERLHTYLSGGDTELDDFDLLDGFMTALALVPEQLLPAFWYCEFLGGCTDQELEQLVTWGEPRSTLALIARHWGSVVQRLARGGWWKIRVCDDVIANHEFWWSMGFRQGMDCTEEFWEGLITKERYLELTAAVHQFTQQPPVREMRGWLDFQPVLLPKEHADLFRELVTGVNQVYRELRAG